MLELRRHADVRAFAHVTGGGIVGQPAAGAPRARRGGRSSAGRGSEPRIFAEIQAAGAGGRRRDGSRSSTSGSGCSRSCRPATCSAPSTRSGPWATRPGGSARSTRAAAIPRSRSRTEAVSAARAQRSQRVADAAVVVPQPHRAKMTAAGNNTFHRSPKSRLFRSRAERQYHEERQSARDGRWLGVQLVRFAAWFVDQACPGARARYRQLPRQHAEDQARSATTWKIETGKIELVMLQSR